MMFYINDPKLESIACKISPFSHPVSIDLLSTKDYKKALTDINKHLKKNQCNTSKALKGLILLHLRKFSEAESMICEVISAEASDLSTLSVLEHYFSKTGNSDKILSHSKRLLEKAPDNKDLLTFMFNFQCRSGVDFAAQQATARSLNRLYPDQKYVYWIITSTLLQAETDLVMGSRIFRPLAEKMLLTEADSERMNSHSQFQLLLDVLHDSEKYNEALNLLNHTDLLTSINESDYPHDYTQKHIELATYSGDWSILLPLSKKRVKYDPNDWNVWKSLSSLCFDSSSIHVIGQRLASIKSKANFGSIKIIDRLLLPQLVDLIDETISANPKSRGPKLARLDVLACLNQIDSPLPPNAWNPVDCLNDYFVSFGYKPVCSADLYPLIALVLPDAKVRSSFLKALLDEVDNMDHKESSPGFVFKHLCAYQLARSSRDTCPSLTKIITAYLTHTGERIALPSGKSNGESAKAIDLNPADGFLLLLVSQLVTISSTSNPILIALLASYWLDRFGVKFAKTNHHLRLKLCQLFAPQCLTCLDLSLAEFEAMELKSMLLVSCGHVLIQPCPILVYSSSPINDQPSQPVLQFFAKLSTLESSVSKEVGESLVTAYHSGWYSRIVQFTQFLDRLKHAQLFLSTRIELMHWHLTISATDFDSMLEKLGSVDSELGKVDSKMERMVDCRDFYITPSFDSDSENVNFTTQAQSFTHLKRWLDLRLTTIHLLRSCSILVMNNVKMGDQLLGEDGLTQNIESSVDDRVALAESSIPKQLERLSNLLQEAPSLDNVSDLAQLLTRLTLSPRQAIQTPSCQLPLVTSLSLYLHGPYRAVLDAGTRLVTGLRSSLTTSDQKSCTDLYPLLQILADPFKYSESAFSLDSLASLQPNSSTAPSSVILFFSMSCEVVALDLLFLSMLSSSLRPRSFKLARRKSGKSNKSNNTVGQSNLFTNLDAFGCRLSETLEILRQLLCQLSQGVNTWVQWCKQRAASDDLVNATADLCNQLLPADLLDKYPDLKPSPKSSSIFTSIAQSYKSSFACLASVIDSRLISLARLQKELSVYDNTRQKLGEMRLE